MKTSTKPNLKDFALEIIEILTNNRWLLWVVIGTGGLIILTKLAGAVFAVCEYF